MKNIIFKLILSISLVLPILSYGQATRVTLSQLAQSGAFNNQSIRWDSLTSTWKPFTITASGGTVTSVGLSLPSIFTVTVSPITSSGTLTATLANQNANLVFAGPSTGAAAAPTFRSLVAADIPALPYVPTSRTLTINGTALDLSANRSWSVGTVTSVAALTLGTTGTDVSSSVVNGSTTPVITLNIPTASATNRGALSSTDWTTFNNKQSAISLTTTGSSGSATFISNVLNVPTYTLAGLGGISLTSLSATAPLSYNNTTGAFSITQSSSATSGFLTSTDWNTFNSKQSTITLTTTGTSGAATFSANTLNIPNYSLSGTQNYIPFFNTSSTLSSSGLLWNNGSQRLSLGIPNPDSKITIKNGQRASSLSTFLATQTFDASTNWTTGTNWSITGGKAQASSATSFLTYTPSLSFVGGQSYLITLSISEWTGGSIQVHVGSTTYNIIGSFSKNNYKIVVTPLSSGSVFRIYGNGLTAKLDDIKIETWSTYNLPYLSVHDSIYANYLYQSFPSLSSVYLGDKGSLVSTADFAVSIGSGALSNLNSGSFNTAIGGLALSKNVDGAGNTAIGYSALNVLSGGNYNFALGTNSMGLSYTGNYNISIGEASYYRGIGNNNIIIGTSSALTGASIYPEGSKNIILGDSSATNLTKTTSKNILIGSNLLLPNSGASNQLNIGNIIFGTSVSGTGSTIAGKIGIGNSNPSARFHIKGEGSLSSSISFLVRNSLDTTLLFVRDDIKVGIGTTNIDPIADGANLTIGSSSGGSVSLRSGETIVGRLQANSTQVELYTPAGSAEVILTTNATPRFYVKSDGKVGIGTDTPKSTLQVNGSFGRTPPTIVADDISYTVDSYTNPDSWVIFTAASSSTITLTLPTASNFTGREITFRTINNITVNTNTDIYGPSYTLTTSFLSGAGKNATLVSNGTYWVVVSTN